FTKIDTVIVNNEYQQGNIVIDSIQHCSSTKIKLCQTDSLNNNITWDFGDGTSSTGYFVEHDYTVSGNYTITSTVQTSFGCNYQKIVLLNVNIPTLPSVNIIAPNEVCSSTEFYASVSITGNHSISSVVWNAPSTNIQGSDSIRLNLEQAGIFDLSVDVTTTAGCLLNANKNILIKDKPFVNVLPNIVLCSGAKSDSILLTGNSIGNLYFWHNNNTAIGLPENGQLIIPSFITSNQLTENTSADFTVYATSNNGCVSDSIHFNMTINASPVLNIADTIHQCLGTAQELSLPENLNYQWFPSNGLSCNNCATTAVNINENTAYSIEATGINGCKNRKNIYIKVIQPTQLSINTQDTICPGRSVHLQA
ncbi:MAG: PKD domain-containing protein, partial [Dolichospermum sp.]